MDSPPQHGHAALVELARLNEAQDWVALAEASERALTYTCSDALLMQACPKDAEVAYSVYFAQLRAVAICRSADRLWSAGLFAEATQLYRQLIQGSFVAWENDASPYFAADATAGLAAWRIALVVEHTQGLAPDVRQLLLGCLPRWVYGALCRFESQEPNKSIPGEMVSGVTGWVAALLHVFLGGRERREPLGAATGAQSPVPAGWKTYFRSALPIPYLLHVLGGALAPLGGPTNPFCEWLERQRKRDRRTRILKWTGILTLLAGLVVGGVVLGPQLAEIFRSEPGATGVEEADVEAPAPDIVVAPAPEPPPPVKKPPAPPAAKVVEETPEPEPEPEREPEPPPPPEGEIKVDVAIIRAGTGTDTDPVGKMQRGERFQVVEQRGRWLHIQAVAGAVDGWVREDLVTLDQPSIPDVAGNADAQRWVKVTVDSAIFRNGPSKGHGRAGASLVRGTRVQLLEETSGWVKVRTDDGVEGWVFGKLVSEAVSHKN